MLPLSRCERPAPRVAVAALSATLIVAAHSHGSSENLNRASIQTEVIASGLVYPWSIAFLSSGELLVTELPGRLRTVRDGRLLPDSIRGLPPLVNLFDVAVHPRFDETALIYFSYAATGPGGVGLEVMRARLVGRQLVDNQVIFQAKPKIPKMVMSGGRLLFCTDGTLLVTVGDRSDIASAAQNPQSHLGTVVRITDDGSVPSDNPFRTGVQRLPEVFSYGHRNVQGMALDPTTGTILLAEHGPIGGDELNQLRAGGNYGWPYVTAGKVSQDMGQVPAAAAVDEVLQAPLRTWEATVGPGGLAVHPGRKLSEWQGSVFIASLTQRHLLHITAGSQPGQEERLLVELGERIRDVRVGPDEALYVATDALNGRILRLVSAR